MIVQSSLQQIAKATENYSANIVLLHDSGGVRENTVKALPALIEALQQRGYKLVRVSELAGLQTAEAMPKWVTALILLPVGKRWNILPRKI